MIRAVSSAIKRQVEAMTRKITRHEDYVACFTTPAGQQVLLDLCKRFHLASPTFTPGDPEVTAFKEGQRHVILSILRYINKDTAEIIKQVEESHQNENQ